MPGFAKDRIELVPVDQLVKGRYVVGMHLTQLGLTDCLYLITYVIIDRDVGEVTIELTAPDEGRFELELAIKARLPLLRPEQSN